MQLNYIEEGANGVGTTTTTNENTTTSRRRRRPPPIPTRASKRQRTAKIGLSTVQNDVPRLDAIHQRLSIDAFSGPGEAENIPASGPCVCVPGGSHECRSDAKRPYRPGDTAIIQERYNRVFQLRLEEGGKLDTRYGRYSHDELIGETPGIRWNAEHHQKSGSSSCAGFMHALRLGPVCWGTSVSHRTQIVHSHDAAIIIQRLRLYPGAHVVEAGVGSAALSAQMAWAVSPHGRVSAFEFHSERAIAARKVLSVAKVPATVEECDVLERGFIGIRDGSANAVFLDLPRPEDVVTEAERVLVDGGRVCCFSPCVEQVQRTCARLRAGMWHSIVTITAPVRTFETKLSPDSQPDAEREKSHYGRVKRAEGRLQTRAFSEMKGHTSYLTFATKKTSTSVDEPKPVKKQDNGCVLF